MMIDGDSHIDEDVINRLYPVLDAIRNYHSHTAFGLENIPAEGPAIIATNHSLATYDIALLYLAIYDQTGRITRPLADHLFFKLPYLGEFVEALGACEGTQENARKLLETGNILGVAPGGMREALRPSSERYQILWEKRKGFARLAVETGTPVILAICPKADDLYEVYDNPVTAWAYQKFRIPLFLARGLGISPLPRKVKLTHFLSEPVHPPEAKSDPAAFKRQVYRFHKKLIRISRELIGNAIAHRQA